MDAFGRVASGILGYPIVLCHIKYVGVSYRGDLHSCCNMIYDTII